VSKEPRPNKQRRCIDPQTSKYIVSRKIAMYIVVRRTFKACLRDRCFYFKNIFAGKILQKYQHFYSKYGHFKKNIDPRMGFQENPPIFSQNIGEIR
jgi:hypothetical protein